jgi:hypothetical protein
MDWKKTNNIVALIIFLFTTIIYTMTVAPTVSFWDCGEFIATSFKMSVPHPPGSPLFLLVGRIFSMLPIPGDIAFRVNLISVFSSSITIALAYLVIVHLFREWKGKLESKEDWITAISSGIIGSLTFAFTHSFWFNSSEAEVYAASMLFTALLVWLSLVWAEKSLEDGNEKYLLMISYLVGLAISVHLLNVLALPFVAMIYYYKRYTFSMKTFMQMTAITIVVMLVIYPGIVKLLPEIASIDVFLLILIILAIFALSYWAVLQKKHLLSFIMLSVTFIIIGYTSYGIIPIRSNLNPNIDENNPETVENFLKYVNREQYGDHSITDRGKVWKSNSETASKYTSALDFFWNYQIVHMYNRYFMWQFMGMDEVSGRWNYEFLGIPLLLGLIGMVYHFRGDPKHALAVLALFFATGFAIILYLNQPDPQPRERDYSYVGSFFAFSIWIGFGFVGIIEMIKEFFAGKSKKLKEVGTPVFLSILIVLLIISPIQLLSKNFHSHNRSGNYVAWDYSYNILESCEPNGILFTNGDNDTFPLWYLQEVENIRTDVRIVNLSLLNTDWYIQQLKELEPKVNITLSDAQIAQVQPFQWKTREMSLKIPDSFQEDFEEYKALFAPHLDTMPTEMKFRVSPTVNYGQVGIIRVQDYMIMNILAANQWKKPVYFATTVPQSNLLDELADYLRMEGLVMRVVPFKNWRYSVKKMEENLMEKYQYRFQDSDVYYEPSTVGLLQNYRTGFLALADYYGQENQLDKLQKLIEFEEANIPDKTIPWPLSSGTSVLTQRMVTLKSLYDPSVLDSLPFKDSRAAINISQYLMRFGKYDNATKLLEKKYNENPANAESIGTLVQAYELNGQYDKALELLEKWIEINPADNQAKGMLNRIRRQSQINATNKDNN